MLENNHKTILDHILEVMILNKGFDDLFRLLWLNHKAGRKAVAMPKPAKRETAHEQALNLKKKLMRGYCCDYDPCTPYAGYSGIDYVNGEPVSSLPPPSDAFAIHL